MKSGSMRVFATPSKFREGCRVIAWFAAAFIALNSLAGEAPAEPEAKKAAVNQEMEQSGEPPRLRIDQFKLGGALGDRFDIAVLKNEARVTRYRYEIKDIVQIIGKKQFRYVQADVVLEFGSESGMAEIYDSESAVKDDIRDAVAGFSFEELMHAEGKRRLKDAIVEAVNRRLLTARVRRVYYTWFKISEKSPTG